MSSGTEYGVFVEMCSRIMVLVSTVMLYKLTVSNCTESKTDVPVHCLMHNRALARVETGVWRDYRAKWPRFGEGTDLIRPSKFISLTHCEASS